MDAPCIAGPPERLIFALTAGDDAREVVRTLGRSDIRGPEADGGGFRVGAGVGSWRAAGLSERAKALGLGLS